MKLNHGSVMVLHGNIRTNAWYLHGIPKSLKNLCKYLLIHFWKCYRTFPCQHISISLQSICSSLPFEYGSEILNWLARKTSPLWLIVISVRGSSSSTRLTDWIQAPSRFCRHNKAKQNRKVRMSHSSTHNISSYRTTASNTMDECQHRETNLSDHLFQFWLIQ